jgi:hypothetical protein
VIVRHIARFRSTLPEDIVESEDGARFLQPPGKSVADAIADIFRKLDCKVYYGPGPVLDVTWELGVHKAGRSFGAWLNLVEDYFFWFENRSWTDKLLRRRPAVYLDLLRGLSQELAADPRFSEVRWFASDEEADDMPGAAIPVEEGRPRRAYKRK